jgi:surface protein
MKNMFAKCKSLTSLNLTIFNTNNVTDMDNMFYECSSLDYLDISNFNIENVINKEKIFYKLKKDCKIIYNDNKINKLIS